MYVYFLYSEEQFQEKSEILAKAGKSFVCGTVVVGGTRMNYTTKSTKKTIPRFYDTKIVAEGEENQMVYTEAKTIRKRGF